MEMNKTRKEGFLEYVEEILSASNFSHNDSVIELHIHMPTGETETIVNPNIANKARYINTTYDEALKLKSNPDIYIIDYSIYAK